MALRFVRAFNPCLPEQLLQRAFKQIAETTPAGDCDVLLSAIGQAGVVAVRGGQFRRVSPADSRGYISPGRRCLITRGPVKRSFYTLQTFFMQELF
jgi:hypothetical protein